MIYKFSHDKFNDFSIFEENKLPARAYFIPFGDKEECLATDYITERYNSRMVRVFNEDWDFEYYPRISDMPKELDTHFYNFKKIAVPGCWQFEGYEKPFYVNIRYQFDPHPPYIPADKGYMGKASKLGYDLLPGSQSGPAVEVFNSVGLYRKKFTVNHARRHVLTFLGVSSCLQLYVNGRYVGYSEGSHNSAEFDITGYVIDGNNEMVVLVYKWCNGTYLESQDMFRNNGIFRDVYITDYNDDYIWDYSVKTRSFDNKYALDIDVDATMGEDCKLKASLYFKDKSVKETELQGGKASIELEVPELWSAECPNLYTLYLEIEKEGKSVFFVRQEVGVRTVGVKGNRYLFNSEPIKLKGVNHHDTDPKRGYCMDAEAILRDLYLMKDFNVNCVRTSHYPPDPLLIKAANHIGLYIVDEADIEAHGIKATLLCRDNRLSNNPRWKEHYWDRVYRMFMRDRNNPCIAMWSLGNEAGGYRCQNYCYDRLKRLDGETPIHYEGACRTPVWCYDVVSEMYTSTEKLEKYAAGKLPSKYYRRPYFLCEYAHAMGVGAGSLDKYMDLFLSNDTMMGGCIWEWADHACLDEDGNWLYGGDNGEYAHDYNFCVDGLFYPDRRPHTGAYSMKVAYRPVRAQYVSSNKYRLTNTNYFASTKGMEVKWQYNVNGKTNASGKFDIDIPPRDYYDATLKYTMTDISNDCYIIFSYYDKSSDKLIAEEHIELSRHVPALVEVNKGDIALIEEHDKTIVSACGDVNMRIEFDNIGGNLCSYNVDGVEYISLDVENKGLNVSLYGAAIDNYMYIDGTWKKQGFDRISVTCDAFGANKRGSVGGGRAEINTRHSIFLAGKKRFELDITYTVYPNGYMDVASNLTAFKQFDLPRFGFTLKMPPQYNKVKYYGKGPKENYPDFKLHGIMGIYEDTVENMLEHYIMPQDNGNRCGCRWASVTDDSGKGLTFVARDETFNFSAQPVTADALRTALHDNELVYDGHTCVNLLHFVRGVGSNSCGPDAREEFRCITSKNRRQLSFAFRVIPGGDIKDKNN
ncbi:MAG: hypothetical protein HFH71_02275 [Clostridia bacterium]|nr:hypothetical protein [Clostridia bacterium]